MIGMPGFIVQPSVSVSGRMLSSLASDDRSVPCVLAAYHLPTFRGLGSAVYVIGAVGPSDSSNPMWPLGGLMFLDHSLQPLRAVDESAYNFEVSGPAIELDLFDLDLYSADQLVEAVLRYCAGQLELSPWDDEVAAPLVAECEGWDHFDEFMALPVQRFPSDG